MTSAEQVGLVDRALVRIRASAHLQQTGRERIDMWLGDRAELDVIERRDDLRRLDALLGRRVLLERLDVVTEPLQNDLAILDAEARKLPREFSLREFTRASTSTTMLNAARRRRWHRARAFARKPQGAYDASNNDLLALFFLRNEEARVRLLADALVQFRALRRSPALVDAKDDGDDRDDRDDRDDGGDDNSQGRLTTSGLLASLEQALVCQRNTTSERERALTRLCVVHAPHLAPSTIYEASNLTLELLGRDDRGLLGRGFERVYGSIHTLYSADTPAIVRSFIAENLCGGDVDAFARAVHAWHRTWLMQRCRLPRLARANEAVQRATYEALLRLHACVGAAAPSAVTIARDAGFARSATPQVLLLVNALHDGDARAIVEQGVRARAAMARAYDDVVSGQHRARLLRLDRDVEHVVVSALGDAVQSRMRGATEHAVRAVVQSGLHALGSREAARAFERARGARRIHAAAVRVADEVRAFLDERARAVHFAGVRVLLDPRFVDRLVKESALHALIELTAPRASGSAVRVISRPSASSFRATIVRKVRAELPDVECVVVDEANAPPGYSHASVLARERGTGLLVVRSLADVPRGVVHLEGDVLRTGAGPTRRRITKRAVLHAPDLRGDPATITLRALGALTLDERRAIAGEKAAVLAELLKIVPTIDGLVVPFARVAQWVREAGLFDAWMGGDMDARTLRRKLRPDVKMMMRLPIIIVRSSGSAEDRPFKSDAGIALSVACVRTEAQLRSALVQIVAATWSKRSLDAQARAGVAMKRVWPAILLQRDLSRDALLSGVAISRGRDGALGAISYQCVRGAGGAVRGGRKVEEGHVSPVEHVVTRGPALLSNKRARVLGETVLKIERLFFDVIEPGAGHAVDVEWLWTKRGLVIVQARTLAR